MKTHYSLLGVLLICLMATASSVQARTYGPNDDGRRFNDGTSVHCHKVTMHKNSTDPDRLTGTIGGAAIGLLAGKQIGGGNGNKLATVGGALAGAAAGRYIQGQHQQLNGDRRVRTVCERR